MTARCRTCGQPVHRTPHVIQAIPLPPVGAEREPRPVWPSLLVALVFLAIAIASVVLDFDRVLL